MLSYNECLCLVESEISRLQYNKQPAELYAPIQYILSLGGKRIRPCMAILSHSLFSNSTDDILYPALGIEVFHNFTLLHDDIMDKAPLRRGNPTVHERWNNSVAILSGDAMMIEAYKLIMQTKPEVFPRIFKLFNKTALEVCEGQQFDMNFENERLVSIEQYLEMIRLKTAVLLAASMAIGAITGGAMDEDIENMYLFGLNTGLAFQLQDDYLDVYAKGDKFGKSIGGDILSNKKTFLLISALQRATVATHVELNEWIEKTTFDPIEKVSAVTRIYNELQIGELTQNKVSDFFRKGMEYFEKVNLPPTRKEHLKGLVEAVMGREK